MHNGFRKLFAVAGQPAEGQGGSLLDVGHAVQQQRPQKCHHPSIVQHLHILARKQKLKTVDDFVCNASSCSTVFLFHSCNKYFEGRIVKRFEFDALEVFPLSLHLFV